MQDYILEVCVDSVESALEAKRGGATRLELCANLVIGGTTPGYTLFEQVKKETGLPVRVLYAQDLVISYIHIMSTSRCLLISRHFSQAGADGVVIGSLNTDGTLKEAANRRKVKAAGNIGNYITSCF